MHLLSTFFFKFFVRLSVPVQVGMTAAAEVWRGRSPQGGQSEGSGVILWQFLDLLFLRLALISCNHQGM